MSGIRSVRKSSTRGWLLMTNQKIFRVALIQLPYTGTEVKVFPLWAAVGIAILLAQSSISVILAGGVGKNGSTVAVS